MKRMILLRHGQTEWNNAGRFQGTTDIDLDDVGRQQADRAAKQLALLSPDVVYSSDLRRAIDTAAPLVDLTGAPIEVDLRLRERSFGPWEGLTRSEISAEYGESFADWQAGRPFHLEGLETKQAVAERGGKALFTVVDRLPTDGTAVLVSHGGLIRQALAAFLGWTASQAETIAGLNNCCWADLREGHNGWRMHGLNISAP